MTTCERCEEMGGADCDNCPLGNPCLGCEHDGVDCTGQCCNYEPAPPAGYTADELDSDNPFC